MLLDMVAWGGGGRPSYNPKAVAHLRRLLHRNARRVDAVGLRIADSGAHRLGVRTELRSAGRRCLLAAGAEHSFLIGIAHCAFVRVQKCTYSAGSKISGGNFAY